MLHHITAMLVGQAVVRTLLGSAAASIPVSASVVVLLLLRYIGRLKNGKVFDKTGNKPFTFRLGE